MTSGRRPPRISVIGGSRANEEHRKHALQAGQAIARHDAILVCGGLGGVMKAACRGAKQEGGTTVGILPTRNASDANEYVDVPVVTGMGDARNVSVALSGSGVVAVGGRFGTLSEIALALNAGKPVVAVQSLDVGQLMEAPSFQVFKDSENAVNWLFSSL